MIVIIHRIIPAKPILNIHNLNFDVTHTLVTAFTSHKTYRLEQCFLTAGPRPGTGPWLQLYRAARGSPGIDNQFICNFLFVNMPHHTRKCTYNLYDYAIINY